MATYYIKWDAAGSGDGSSWENAYTTIQAALNARTTPGSVFEISGGSAGNTYSETLITKCNGTIKGSSATEHSGLVTIDASAAATHALRVDHDVTLSKFKLYGATGTNYGLALLTAKTIMGSDIIIDLNGRAIYNTAAGNINLTKSIISNTVGLFNTNGAGSTLNINYSKIVKNTVTISIINGIVTLNNNVISGFPGQAIDIDGNNAQTANIYNNIITANSVSTVNAHIIENTSTNATVNEGNNLILPNPFDPDNYYVSGITLTNPVADIPMIQSYKRVAKVCLNIDDYANLAHFKNVADYANGKGIPINIAIDTASLTVESWANVAAYVAVGNGVACHSKNHVQLANMNAITIIGPATATLTTTFTTTDPLSENWIGTITAKEGVTIKGTLNVDGTTTIADVKTFIDAIGGGWSATVHVNANINCLASCLEILTDHDVTGAGYLVQYKTTGTDANELWHVEVSEAKKIIESNITGYTCNMIVFPYGSTSAALRAWVSTDSHGYFTKAGTTPFLGGATTNVGSYTLSADYSSGLGPAAGLQVFNLCRFLASGQWIGVTNVARNTAAIIEWLGYIGGALNIYDHGSVAYSLADWQIIIDTIKKSNASVLTYNDLLTYIRGGTDADADGNRWTRVYTDQSNYHLLTTSPCRDAGTDVGLTTDFEGKPVPMGSAPDIGAYEWVGGGGLFLGLGLGGGQMPPWRRRRR